MAEQAIQADVLCVHSFTELSVLSHREHREFTENSGSKNDPFNDMNAFFHSTLFKKENLLKIFEEIHDHIYANDGLSPQQALEEIVKILFVKFFDENANQKQFVISEQEYSSLKQGQKVSDFAARIDNLFAHTVQAYPDIFAPDERIRLSHEALGFTVSRLQHTSFSASSQDAKGLAFQKFLSRQEKHGRGQFFTPEPVIDFCVQIIQPDPHETIVDPACGSGGFLMSALKYLKYRFADADLSDIISKNLWGFDINRSIARIARMKLLLEANAKTNIFCANSLDNLDEFLSANPQGFDIVLTNPPFGAGGKIADRQILEQFDLGCKWAEKENRYMKTEKICPRPAEILFVERCLQLLKPGGRMGIVLPNGHFENPSLAHMRYFIRQKAKILAIVNLPQETFVPFGTGVKTSLLFLQKQSISSDSSYPVFFGKIKKLGYQGNKNASPVYRKDRNGYAVKDEQGQPVPDEDFSGLVRNYKNFLKGNREETQNSFSLSSEELKSRFDYDFYAPENRRLIHNSGRGNTVRLGDVCEIAKAKSPKLKRSDLMVAYVELSDINPQSFEIVSATAYQVHELPSRASYEIRAGDILTAIAGNSVGTQKHATALVTEEFEGSICSNGFRVLRNFSIDIYFMLYFLKSELFLRQMLMYRTGAAIPNVADKDLGNILIPLPNDGRIKQISEKMKHAFALRQMAKKEMESIPADILQWPN